MHIMIITTFWLLSVARPGPAARKLLYFIFTTDSRPPYKRYLHDRQPAAAAVSVRRVSLYRFSGF